MHRHLQEKVAQLFLDLGVVTRVDRLEQLVRLLKQIGTQRLVGLLAIPWTTARRAKPGHHLEYGFNPGRIRRVRRLGHGFRFCHGDVAATLRPASYSSDISSRRRIRSSFQPSPWRRILIRLGRIEMRPAIRRDSSPTSRNRSGSTRIAMSWPSETTPRSPNLWPRSFTRSE